MHLIEELYSSKLAARDAAITAKRAAALTTKESNSEVAYNVSNAEGSKTNSTGRESLSSSLVKGSRG